MAYNETVSKIYTLRKAGNITEARKLAIEALAESPDSEDVQRVYGWVLFDILKEELARYNSKRILKGRLVNTLQDCTSEYRKLKLVKKPDSLHSMILIKVTQGAKETEWIGFLDFVRWWNLKYLRSDDVNDYITIEGDKIPSLKKRVLYRIGHCMTNTFGRVSRDLSDYASEHIQKAIELYPNEVWFKAYYAKYQIFSGRPEEGLALYRSILRENPNLNWLWAWYADALPNEDKNNKVVCYYKAILLTQKLLSVVNIRIKLAQILHDLNRDSEAAFQVEAARKSYLDNNYAISPKVQELLNTNWFKGASAAGKYTSPPDMERAAMELLAIMESELVFRTGVIDHHNKEKGLAHALFEKDEGLILRYSRFPSVVQMPIGLVVTVGVEKQTGAPYKIQKSDKSSIEGLLETKTGQFEYVYGRPFGFVNTSSGESIFVHEEVLKNVDIFDGDTVTCNALMSYIKKKNNYGWKAISVKPCETDCDLLHKSSTLRKVESG